jgi:hypothetical protein
MVFIERLSLKERFRSPAALAVFGAFAVPEPFGTLVLAYAAFWWWRSRKNKAGKLNSGDEPLFTADIARQAAEYVPAISAGSTPTQTLY